MRIHILLFALLSLSLQCTNRGVSEEASNTTAHPSGKWILLEMTAPDRPGDMGFELLAELEKESIWTFGTEGQFSQLFAGESQPERGTWTYQESDKTLLISRPNLDGSMVEALYQINQLTANSLKLQEVRTNFHLIFRR